MSEIKAQVNLIYIGVAGGDLGFKLAGMETLNAENGETLVITLKDIKRERPNSIVFIDEQLAEDVWDEVAKLNENTMPALVLLADPANPQNLAAKKMAKLMIRAVGSNIFGS